MMNIQEFDTVTRYKLSLVLLVWNDAGFGAEAHKLRAKEQRPEPCADWDRGSSSWYTVCQRG